jgi:hypothetical protein
MLGEWIDDKYYIEGLEYTFPKRPPLKTIRNYGIPKTQQVWVRRNDYEDLNWEDGWERRPENLRYLEEELTRIYDGEWIFIDGEPEYLNGMMYFFLQWFILHDSGDYPDFRDTSLYYFRFLELVVNSRLCTGHTLIKSRRLGATSMIISYLLRKMLIVERKSFGITSKTAEDANSEGAFGFLTAAFEALPVFLKPEIPDKETPKKVLYFRKKSQKGKSHGKDSGLNNRCMWRSPGMNTFDSGAYEDIMVDECLSPETKIMMSDGSFKPIGDINIGDLVMVEGGKTKKVVNMFFGYDDMYRVIQPYGEDYVVNSKHRLYLEQRMGGGSKSDGIKIITPEEYLNLNSYKRVTGRVVSSGIDFREKDLPIDPYIFGLWLGDGSHYDFSILVNIKDDVEIADYLTNYGDSNKLNYHKRRVGSLSHMKEFVFRKDFGDKGVRNRHIDILRDLNVYRNKHIPEIYLKNSREHRLNLLAGIIDSDGHLPITKGVKPKGSFEIAMSRKEVIEQIRYLAMSLGFSCSNVAHKRSNLNTDVYRISISGDLESIPTKVKRKRFINYKKSYKTRRSKIDVKYEGYGEYVGIQVDADNDNDRRLILGDFTLTMNCGKFDRKKTKVDVHKYLPIVTKCVKKGAKVTGKLHLPTTVNPPEEGGSNYRVVWDASDQTKSDYLGQTKSGLYRIMIPAYYGFAGYIDQYGKSVYDTPTPEQQKYLESTGECPDPKIGAKQYQDNIRKNLENDPEALQQEIQMNPWNAEEVFEAANERCHFNVANINTRIRELELEMESRGLNIKDGEMGRRGWFKEGPSGKVHWEDDIKGMWYIHKFLPPGQDNKYELVNGKKVPTNEMFGAAGLDPIDAGRTTVDKGSDACCIIRSRYSSQDPEGTGIPVAMFLGRPEDNRVFHEQVFNGLRYYGVKALAETSPRNWLDYAIDKGLQGYLYGTKKSNGVTEYGIPNQQSDNTKKEHVEVQQLSSLEDWNKIPYIGLLRNRLGFNIAKRTEWDICMADGYALMALSRPFKEIRKVNLSKSRVINRGSVYTH